LNRSTLVDAGARRATLRDAMPSVVWIGVTGRTAIAIAVGCLQWLLQPVPPQCEVVPDHESEHRKRRAQRACDARIAELAIQGAALALAGFVLGGGAWR
jgi:hypothetical protein